MKISSSPRPQAAGAEVSGFMIYGRVSPVQRGIILSTPSVFSPRICELSHLFLAKVLIAWAKNNGHKGQFLSGFTLESGGWLFPNTHPGCAQRTTLRASFPSWSHVVQVGKAVVPPYFFQMFLTLGRVVGLKGVGEPTCDPKTAITNLWAKLRLSEGLAATLQLPLVTAGPVGTPRAPSPKSHPGRCPLCRPQCCQLVTKLEASLSASVAVSWIIYCNYAGDPHEWCYCALSPGVCKHTPRARS